MATLEALVRHLVAAERRLVRMKHLQDMINEEDSAELTALLIAARAAVARVAEQAADVLCPH